MRSVVLLSFVVAACTPDIAPATYLCGEEESCPSELACDGKTNLCVDPGSVLPFTCRDDDTEVEPNNSADTAQPVVGLSCGGTVEITGCEGKDGDDADYFRFTVPEQCALASIAVVRMSYPLAYEPPALDLLSTGGADVLTDQPCTASVNDEDGDGASCGRGPVTAGMAYTLRVTGSGEKNCGGTCAHNRYRLTVTLTQ